MTHTSTIAQLKQELAALGVNYSKFKLKAEYEQALIVARPLLAIGVDEQRVADWNADLYHSLKPIISEFPDFRPAETVKKMKKVRTAEGKEIDEPPPNPWTVLSFELTTLGRPGSEADNEREFVDLLSGDDEVMVIEWVINYPKFITSFYATYPGLTWVISRVMNHQSTAAYFIAIRRLDYFDFNKLKKFSYSLLQVIPDLETAHQMRQRGMKVLGLISDTPASRGHFLWLVSEPGFVLNYSISRNAILYGMPEIAERFIASSSVSEDNVSNIFSYAIEYNAISVIKKILSRPSLVLSKSWDYYFVEAAKSSLEMFEILLADSRADPSEENVLNIIRYPKRIVEGVIELLLADPRVTNEHVNKAIHSCIDEDNVNTLQILLDDPRADWSMTTINSQLIDAMQFNNYLSANIILSHPRFTTNADNMDVIWRVTFKNNNQRNVVRILMNNPIAKMVL